MDAGIAVLLSDLTPEALLELRGTVRSDPEKRVDFRESGGVELLLAKLSNTKSGGESIQMKAEILFTLSFCCDEEAKNYIRGAGGLDTAAVILQRAIPFPDAFECCTYAIGLLANYSYRNKMIFFKKGIVEILAQAIEAANMSKTRSPRMILNMANVMKTIGEECFPVKEAILKSGLLEALCKVAFADNEVSGYVCGALASVIHKYPTAVDRVLELNALELLSNLDGKHHQEAARFVFACLKEKPHSCEEFISTLPSLTKQLSVAASDFATKEVRNDVLSTSPSVTQYVDCGGGKVRFCGATSTHRVTSAAPVALEVQVDHPPHESNYDLSVQLVDVAIGKKSEMTLTLFDIDGRMLTSSSSQTGSCSVMWNVSNQKFQLLEITTTSPETSFVISTFAGCFNEECRAGGMAVTWRRTTEVRSTVQFEQTVPPPPASEVSEIPTAADPFKEQLAELFRRVSTVEGRGAGNRESVVSMVSEQNETMKAEQKTFKETIARLEREGIEQRRTIAQQESKILQMSETSHVVSGNLTKSIENQTTEVRTIREDLHSVTSQLQQLDAECTTNEMELSRFLKQISKLREKLSTAPSNGRRD